ncbi:hypothetical protein Hanom_Chr05g00436481 [Helianthus anomalus]
MASPPSEPRSTHHRLITWSSTPVKHPVAPSSLLLRRSRSETGGGRPTNWKQIRT